MTALENIVRAFPILKAGSVYEESKRSNQKWQLIISGSSTYY